MNSWSKEDLITLYLVPGEIVQKKSILFNCLVVLTNYRIYCVCKNHKIRKNDIFYHFGIPLNLIFKIEQLEFKYLRIWTKLGTFYILSFDNTEDCSDWMKIITDSFLSKKVDSIFAFKYFDAFKQLPRDILFEDKLSWEMYSSIDSFIIEKEFKRMNFNDIFWKITSVNEKFQICSSYPRYHIVPEKISDEQIALMADFRGNRRFPSVVWRSQKNGAVIIRCAQPQVGLMCWRNTNDEKFFKEVFECLTSNKNNKKLVIVDARHYSTAQFNRIRGGGVEYSEYYGEAEIMFMQLENIHSVRSSFDYISLFAINADNWLVAFENSYWLKYVSKLLKSATDIAKTINEDARSVIIHCSDGWDRTPQLTSLAQILLDSYYRTIEGFQLLIEKEWILFGHKFSERCSLGRTFDNKERSPVFVQWLDCLHQLIKQYPMHFEFNETFLIKLAIHAHSGLFGNFLFNTEEERRKNNIRQSTISIWQFLSPSNMTIINPLYFKNSEPKSEHGKYTKVLCPLFLPKFLHPWNRLFFEALNSPESQKMFCLDYCASKNETITSFQNNSIEDFHEEPTQLDSASKSVPNEAQTNLKLPRVSNLKKAKSDSDLSKNKKSSDIQLQTTTFDKTHSSVISNDLTIKRTSFTNFSKTNTSNTFINKFSSVQKLSDSCSISSLSKIKTDMYHPSLNYNNSLEINGDFSNHDHENDEIQELLSNNDNNSNKTPFLSKTPLNNNSATSINKYQQIELIAYPTDTNSSLSNGELNQSSSIHKTSNGNVTHEIIPEENSVIHLKESETPKYFQIYDFDELKPVEQINSNPFCDLDGIYKVVEPVNKLHYYLNNKIKEQSKIIKSLKEQNGINNSYENITNHNNNIKIRTDSYSSMDRPRNEDSVSSHDSYVLLDSSPNNSKPFNGIKMNGDLSTLKLNKLIINSGNEAQFSDNLSFNKDFILSQQLNNYNHRHNHREQNSKSIGEKSHT